MRNTITFAFVALAGLSLAAQGQQSSTSAGTPNGSGQNAQQDRNVTVTGCLTAGSNNTFTLVAPASNTSAGAASTGTTATTPAGSKVVKTITYALSPSGSVDLRSNAGHKVQVTGTETPAQASATEVDRSAATERAEGTTGRTPVVHTTEQAQIVQKQLNVTSVKQVADKCDILK